MSDGDGLANQMCVARTDRDARDVLRSGAPAYDARATTRAANGAGNGERAPRRQYGCT
jgi:hypothetical protein